MWRAVWVAFFFASALLTGAAQAAETISASDAKQRAEAGEIVIVDVRSPAEWAQTGVPAGAAQVTIHDPQGARGFADKLSAVIAENPGRPVAFICAAGNRSTTAAAFLERMGASKVYNIKEGMMGSAAGPGWLARSLPMEKCAAC